ncbi:ricin-type beta-trefoil lectin domain protein [Kitasatospora sp. DSM 101779]|uniref:ricin-type beta-trefoil lectin domain protein n=1 Tax=Kitasatospora sp. DSM 101779 TaxID=2853165 RepID=UPI0021D9130B|nr:ricin-type beta-trefoil lectin domain protein [Kitasatospora sp. DSM 101779]MCU7820995.1 ricin-type beta-trefoil lectin domain protein [Kitasatospora sp. DSM 101779]
MGRRTTGERALRRVLLAVLMGVCLVGLGTAPALAQGTPGGQAARAVASADGGRAQAADACKPAVQGSYVSAACTREAGTRWYVYAVCRTWVVTDPGYLVYGNVVTGSGTSAARCTVANTFVSGAQVYTYPPQPTAVTGPIVGVFSGKCVDVDNGSDRDGTPVQIFPCNGTAAQKWSIVSDGRIVALGKCLDVKHNGTANGTIVQLYTCNGGGNQQWTRTANGGLMNPRSGKCLDNLGFNADDRAPLGIWDCNGLGNQQWTLPVG